MPKLEFRVRSNWEEVLKLRQQIDGLKTDLKKVDISPDVVKKLEGQLAKCTKRYEDLVVRVQEMEIQIQESYKNIEDILNGANDSLKGMADTYSELIDKVKSQGEGAKPFDIFDDADLKEKKQAADELIKTYDELSGKLEESKQKLKGYYEGGVDDVETLKQALTEYKELAEQVGEAASAAYGKQKEYVDALNDKLQQTKKDIEDVGESGGDVEKLTNTMNALSGEVTAGEVAMGLLKDGMNNAAETAKAAGVSLETLKAGAVSSTVAVKALRAALWSIGIGVIITLFTLLADKLIDLGKAFFAESEEARKMREQLEELEVTFSKKYMKTITTTLLEYQKMRSEYGKLRNEHEKTEWLDENARKIDNFGVAINDVSDAERFFKNDTENVIRSFSLRAQAAAYAAKAAKMYEQAMSHNAGDEITKDDIKRLGLKFSDYYTEHGIWSDTYTLSEYGAKKYNDYEIKKIEDSANDYINTFADLEKRADDVLGSLSKKRNKTDMERLQERRDDLDRQLKLLSEEEAAGKKGVELRRKINELDKRLHLYSPSASRKDENAARNASIKQGEAEEKMAQIKSMQQVERERAARDLELSTREAEIKAMKDGTEKKLRQIELDRDRELDAIARAYEDVRLKRIEEAKRLWDADTKNKGKNFYESGVFAAANVNTEEETANMEARRDAAIAISKKGIEDIRKAQRQQLLDYLKEYGDMQAQREAITEEYDRKIADTDDAVQKASLQKQKERLIAELNMKELQRSINWEDVFGNLDRQSVKSLESLKERLIEALDAKDITVENARTLAEKIREIEDNISRRTDMWSAYLPGLRERMRLTQKVLEAEREIKGLQTASDSALSKQMEAAANFASMVSSRMNGDNLIQQWGGKIDSETLKEMFSYYDIQHSSKELQDAFALLQATTVSLSKSQEDLRKVQKDLESRQNALKNFTKGGDIAQYFKDVTAGMGITGISGLVNQNAQSMVEFVDKIGAGETEFGKSVHDFADGVGGFNNAIQSLASGDVFGAINGVLDGFAGLGNALGRPFGLGGADYTSYNDMVEKYNHLISVWDELISRKQEYLDISYGPEALKTRKEIEDLYAKEVKAYKELGKERLNSGASTGSHSIGRRMADNMSSDNWQDIANALGWTVNYTKEFIGTSRMTGLFDLTADQLRKIQEEAGVFWEHMDEDVRKYLENIIKSDDAMQKSIDAAKERITGMSFDSVFDGFMSRLYDLADGVENVTENAAEDWQKMVNKMVLNNLVGSKYKENLRKWYEQWESAYSGDKTITSDEIAELRTKYNSLLQEASDEVEALRKAGIVTATDEVTGQQSASVQAMERLNVDQGNEIVGRLNAGQMMWQQGNDQRGDIREELKLSNMTITEIRSMISEHRDIADDTRDILSNVYLEVKEVNEHQTNIERSVTEIHSEITEIRRNIKDFS